MAGLSETTSISLNGSRQLTAPSFVSLGLVFISFLRHNPWGGVPGAPLQTRLITSNRRLKEGNNTKGLKNAVIHND